MHYLFVNLKLLQVHYPTTNPKKLCMTPPWRQGVCNGAVPPRGDLPARSSRKALPFPTLQWKVWKCSGIIILSSVEGVKCNGITIFHNTVFSLERWETKFPGVVGREREVTPGEQVMFPVASKIINCHPSVVAVQVHPRSLSHPRQTPFLGYILEHRAEQGQEKNSQGLTRVHHSSSAAYIKDPAPLWSQTWKGWVKGHTQNLYLKSD